MRLSDIVASVDGAAAKFGAATVKLRRNAVLYASGAFFAVVAIVYAASASVLALEVQVGEIYARLIVAGVFALLVLAIVLTLWLSRRPPPVRAAPIPLQGQRQNEQRSAQFAQIAMIVEAVMLGYSMARRR